MTNLEQRLADTGNPERDGYAQWLPSTSEDSLLLQKRVHSANLRKGVNLVDHPVEEWNDSRVCYLSYRDESLVVSLQYAGARLSLARLALVLSSDEVFESILSKENLWRRNSRSESESEVTRQGNRSDLGEQYESKAESDLRRCIPLSNLESEVTRRIIREYSQVGHLSDATTYGEFRQKIQDRRNDIKGLLTRMGKSNSDTARSRLLRYSHGLVASLTHLLHHIGIETTFEIRIPDLNRTRKEEFLDFVAHTLPKNAVINQHSFYRRVYESDEELRRRQKPLSVEENRVAELTATWVIAGHQVSTLQDEIRERLERYNRENLNPDGEQYEEVFLPVTVGDTWSREGIESAVLTATDNHALGASSIDEWATVLAELVGSTYDVVDGLTSAPASLEKMLTALPDGRILPDHEETLGNLLRVLLVADGPIGRSDICQHEVFDYSPSSYDNHIGKIGESGLAQKEGRKWVVTVERLLQDQERRDDSTGLFNWTPPQYHGDTIILGAESAQTHL